MRWLPPWITCSTVRGGYPIEKGWWKKSPEQFLDQVERYCVCCSAAIPMEPVDANCGKDLISPSIEEKLKKCGSPKYKKGMTETMNSTYTAVEIKEKQKEWKPWSHRPFRQCGPDSYLDDNNNIVNHRVFHDGK